MEGNRVGLIFSVIGIVPSATALVLMSLGCTVTVRSDVNEEAVEYIVGCAESPGCEALKLGDDVYMIIYRCDGEEK